MTRMGQFFFLDVANFALALLLFELIGVIIAVAAVIFMVSVVGYSLS
ncbi:hypothetical protein [Lederbergia ruris]|nr:hypothetical protein [Lederbergia ruris]